ncbi:MAG: hypothetical protein KC503_31335 [Myxococcales bacterium]|nr:hypothetical protein [Myxococcales bacterium]
MLEATPSPTRRVLLAVVSLLLLCGVVNSRALAADADKNARDFRRATSLFADGRFAVARKLLLALRERVTDAKLLARVHLYLGLEAAVAADPQRTRDAFARALMLDPRISVDPQRFKPALVSSFQKVRATVRGKLAVTLVGGAAPPGASVWLDGARVGAPPYSGVFPVGEHRVELRGADGKVLQAQTVVLNVAAEVALAWTVDGGAARSRRLTPAPGSDKRNAERRGKRLWTWIAGGSALAAFGVALGLGLSAKSDRDAACELVDPSGGNDCQVLDASALSSETRARYDELRDRLAAKRTATNVLLVAGGVLAVTSVVLFFLEGRAAKKKSRVQALLGHGLVVHF